MSQSPNYYGQEPTSGPDFYSPTPAPQPSPPVYPQTPAQPTYSEPQAWGQPSADPMNFGYTDPAPANLVPAQNYAQPPQPGQGAGSYGAWSPAMNGQVLVQLGSIVVTDTEVHTPAGSIPLGEAYFTFFDQTYTTRKTPGWAVAAAIIGFFIVTLFSLFFLMVKENQTTGQVVIGVQGGGLNYSEPIFVQNYTQVADLAARVNYANQAAATRQG